MSRFASLLSPAAKHLSDTAMIGGCIIDQLVARVGITLLLICFIWFIASLIRDIRNDNAKSETKGQTVSASTFKLRPYPPNGTDGYQGYADPDDNSSPLSTPEFNYNDSASWSTPSDDTANTYTDDNYNVARATLQGQPHNVTPTIAAGLLGIDPVGIGLKTVTTWNDLYPTVS